MMGKAKSFAKRCKKNIFKYILTLATAILTCFLIADVDFATMDNPIMYGFLVAPIIVLTGLYGINIATLSFTMIFIFEIFNDFGNCYAMFGFAGVFIITYWLMYESFFRNILKSALSVVIYSVVLSLFYFITINVFSSMDEVMRGLHMMIQCIPLMVIPSFVSVLFLYIMNIIPVSKVKALFPGTMLSYQQSRQVHYYNENGVRYRRIMGMSRFLMGCFAVAIGVLVTVCAVELIDTVNRTDDMSGRVVNIMCYGWKGLISSVIIRLGMITFCNAVILVVIVDHALEHWIIGPVVELSSTFRNFAKAEAQDRWLVADKLNRLGGVHRDEIGDLRDSLVETTEEMLRYVDQINANQFLRDDLKVAKTQNDAKNNFLSTMSHEIRTPINAIVGLDEMILRESQNSDIIGYAKGIKSASNTLISLVNDVLDFSRIESGEMQIECIEYSLSTMLNDIINMIEPKANDKGLDLKVNIDEEIPNLLYGDETRLKQCVINILTNAVKFTMVGSVTMDVGYEIIEDSIILLKISVTDTGIGIKESELETLFIPFERSEEHKNANIEGTGLGLSVVRKLLTMMDAGLKVESKYGEGSTFSFGIMQRVIKSEAIGSMNGNQPDSLEGGMVYQETLHAPDARVLVVDDVKINLTVMKGLLKDINLKLDTASSGMMALKYLDKKKYDLVFLDHRMPEMDGVEVLRALKERKDSVNIDTPVIALTANAVAGARETYIGEGFVDYLSKPVDSGKLEKMLIEYLPPDKVILPDDPNFAPTTMKSANTNFLFDADNPLKDARFAEVSGVDLKEGLEHCLKEEILIEAIQDFQANAVSKAEKIEDLLAAQDYNNYTIEVHSLKSSARLIGATKLSEEAAYLESCGNFIRNSAETEVTLMDNGKDAISELYRLTPRLLNLLKSYEHRLAAFEDIEYETFDEREEISEEQLFEAYAGIREFIDAFDFESAESIIKMLEIYKIPDKEREKYDIIKKMVNNIEREKLLEVLDE